MPKTKQKSKSCNRGYPCGGSCISRGFNCRKKLAGQGKNYADWLKRQGDRLGDEFNQEVGKRLAIEINGKLKINKSKNVKDGLKGLLSIVNDANKSVLESDKKMLAVIQDLLKNSEKNIENYQRKLKQKKITQWDKDFYSNMLEDAQKEQKIAKQEVQELTEAIAKREKEIAQDSPQNQIKKFSRASEIDKELRQLKSDRARRLARNLSDADRLKKLLDESVGKANQIVPFKKRRGGINNFAEDTSIKILVDRYLELRSQFTETLQSIQEILDEFALIVNR